MKIREEENMNSILDQLVHLKSVVKTPLRSDHDVYTRSHYIQQILMLQICKVLQQPVRHGKTGGRDAPDPYRRGTPLRGGGSQSERTGRSRGGPRSEVEEREKERNPQEIEEFKEEFRQFAGAAEHSLKAIAEKLDSGEVEKRPSREKQMSLGQLAALIHRPAMIGQVPVIPHGIKAKSAQDQDKIIIKQQVKQVINQKKRRRRKATAGTKQTLKAVKKEYTTHKKSVKAKLMQGKKAELAKRLTEISGMPAKQRAAARKKLRAEIKSKYSKLVALLVPLGKKNYDQIKDLITKIKGLR